MYTEVKSSKSKLQLLKNSITNENFNHFSNCLVAVSKFTKNVNWRNLKPIFTTILNDLISEFENRFADFASKSVEIEIFRNPFSVDITSAPVNLQMELIDLQASSVLKEAYQTNGLLAFYKSISNEKFPELQNNAKKFAVAFGSTYRCEETFSKMNRRKNKLCARLTDQHLDTGLRLSSTKIQPNIPGLAKQIQIHKSH